MLVTATLIYIYTGVPLRAMMSATEKILPSQQTITDLSEAVAALFSYLSVRRHIIKCLKFELSCFVHLYINI